MYKNVFALAVLALGSVLLSGCTVYDDEPDGPDTTIVNPAPSGGDTDVTITPPAGGSVDIDR